MKGREVKEAPRLVMAGPTDRVLDYDTMTWVTSRFSCDGCDYATPVAVVIGSHSDNEYGPCHYCPGCVRTMMELTR